MRSAMILRCVKSTSKFRCFVTVRRHLLWNCYRENIWEVGNTCCPFRPVALFEKQSSYWRTSHFSCPVGGENLDIKASIHIYICMHLKTKHGRPLKHTTHDSPSVTPGAFPLPNWKCISCLWSWNETLIPRKKRRRVMQEQHLKMSRC